MPSPPSLGAGEVSQARAGRPGVRWGQPRDPHGSASREQAGGPGEGTPPSQELWGPALGCPHHRSTSHSGENQTISRLARETPAPAGPGRPRPAPPGWAQGSVRIPQRWQGAGARLTCHSHPSPPLARPAGWCDPQAPAPCRRRPARAPGTSWCCHHG